MNRSNNSCNNKFHRKAITVNEALQAVLNRICPVDIIDTELMASTGHILAEDLYTKQPIPHFRRSGMDGYAVRTEDITLASSLQPAELTVIEEIPCGKEPKHAIKRGTASRIMTGGMVPDGADTVIMLEMTEEFVREDQSCVRIRKPDTRGTNISSVGEEVEAGALVLEKGQRIGAGQMAVLAALGYSRVKVYRKPKVAIVSVGTELLHVSEPLQMGKIRNSNAYMLTAQIRSAGGDPMLVQHLPDEDEQAERIIYEWLNSTADLVVTTGGVSVGDYDIMADFFTRWGGTTLFNKIAMRPGSPTSAGVWRNKLLFGLSGNPAACFVGFELFVRPALLEMQGASREEVQEHTAFLAVDYMKPDAFTRYVRGKRYFHNGMIYVKPVGLDKSSAMITIKDANCLIVIPPSKTGIRAGEMIRSIPLQGGI